GLTTSIWRYTTVGSKHRPAVPLPPFGLILGRRVDPIGRQHLQLVGLEVPPDPQTAWRRGHVRISPRRAWVIADDDVSVAGVDDRDLDAGAVLGRVVGFVAAVTARTQPDTGVAAFGQR